MIYWKYISDSNGYYLADRRLDVLLTIFYISSYLLKLEYGDDYKSLLRKGG